MENSGYNAHSSGSWEMVSGSVSGLIHAGQKHGCWAESALLLCVVLAGGVAGSLKLFSMQEQPVGQPGKRL